MEPILPTAVLGAIAALGLYLRRRRRERETAFLEEMALRRAGASLVEDEEGASIAVHHRGVPVTVAFEVPEGKEWERGLCARARYAIGAGPTFTAAPRDVASHARAMGSAYPLDVRFGRGYDLSGDHREARALVMPVLARLDTRTMPAPMLVSDGEQIRVYLPEHLPRKIGRDGHPPFAQLVALTGELALFGQDLLQRIAEQLGGSLVIDRSAEPVLSARYARGGATGTIVLRFRAPASDPSFRSFSLRIEARREGAQEPDVTRAVRALDPALRPLAEQLLSHADVRSTPTAIVIDLGVMPGPDELTALHAVLGQLVAGASPRGPFR